MVDAGKSLPIQEFLSLSPFSPASGSHTTRCPEPGEQISSRIRGLSKETFFFFARKEETPPSNVGPYRELMSPNHNVKEAHPAPISDKCVLGYTHLGQTLPGASRSPRQTLDRVRVLGKTLLPRELARARPRGSPAVPAGPGVRGPEPLCTFERLLSSHELILPACTHPAFGAFPFMVLI